MTLVNNAIGGAKQTATTFPQYQSQFESPRIKMNRKYLMKKYEIIEISSLKDESPISPSNSNCKRA